MVSSDLVAVSRIRLAQSEQLMAMSHTLIATTLFRVTRGRRLEGGSDSRDGGGKPPAVCVFCKKPIVKPGQSSVTINELAYHTDCWERLETRRTRS